MLSIVKNLHNNPTLRGDKVRMLTHTNMSSVANKQTDKKETNATENITSLELVIAQYCNKMEQR